MALSQLRSYLELRQVVVLLLQMHILSYCTLLYELVQAAGVLSSTQHWFQVCGRLTSHFQQAALTSRALVVSCMHHVEGVQRLHDSLLTAGTACQVHLVATHCGWCAIPVGVLRADQCTGLDSHHQGNMWDIL